MIQELVDPWSLEGRINAKILNPIKTRLQSGNEMIQHGLVEPQRIFPYIARKLSGKTVETRSPSYPSPVLNYKGGSETELSRRALITYLAGAFYNNPYEGNAGHSNGFQSIEIAKAFNRLGYMVDIVDYKDNDFVPTHHYDVFFGMHYNFERFLPYLDPSTTKIYYGTGSYWAFEIASQRKRIQDLKARKGVEYNIPIRLKENNWVQIADAVVVIGNQLNLETYLAHRSQGNIFIIDNSTVPTMPQSDLSDKDFDKAKHNFLWFGSSGLLHKGLDLVLEAFSQTRNAHLWVCGPLEAAEEIEFLKIYRKELFLLPNVHPIGWVDVYSEKFKQLKNKCAFTILASCSEGMPGGILNCMKSGLIPLLSQESFIDTDGFGITFKNNSIEEIVNVINKVQKMDSKTCSAWASSAIKEAETRYSINKFGTNIEAILKNILSQNA